MAPGFTDPDAGTAFVKDMTISVNSWFHAPIGQSQRIFAMGIEDFMANKDDFQALQIGRHPEQLPHQHAS